MNGSKFYTEAVDVINLRIDDVVGERCRPDTSHTVRSGGAHASENAGMSNDNAGENPARRKPKVSWGR